jgi:hypothetical protein
MLAGMTRVTYIVVDTNSIFDSSGSGTSHGR